jgi:glycerophosphoryl diester phosphodiesterase
MSEAADRPLNPWLRRRVIAYAHQGGAFEAPSSTRYAIRRALEAGASGIELDVHASADGVLVVCHDPTVDRTTNGTGAIASMPLEHLRRLDNAYWFVPGHDAVHGLDPSSYPLRGRAPADQDLTIATLAEVLELLDGYPGVALNLDIKQTAPAVEPYEQRLAAALAEVPWSDRVIVASFDERATDAFRSFAPWVATSAGTASVATFVRALKAGEEPPRLPHAALQVPATVGDVVVVDEVFVAAAHRAGMAVHVWTVNDPAEMERLVELGVDGIISDVPSTLVKVLERAGVHYDPSATS